jgi:hypothetical protein
VPTTGQGRVATQDPDLILLVDRHSGDTHFQRVTVLDSSLHLLHRISLGESSTVLHERGRVVTGATYIKPWSEVIIVIVQPDRPGSYRVSYSSDLLNREELGVFPAECQADLLKAATFKWREKFPRGN